MKTAQTLFISVIQIDEHDGANGGISHRLYSK